MPTAGHPSSCSKYKAACDYRGNDFFHEEAVPAAKRLELQKMSRPGLRVWDAISTGWQCWGGRCSAARGMSYLES